MKAHLWVALGLLLVAGCKKQSVAGEYSGAFNGTLTTPRDGGGMTMQQSSEAGIVTVTGDAPATIAFELKITTSSGKTIPLKCTLKAERVGDPSQGNAELTIAEQECASDAPFKVEGKMSAPRGAEGFESIALDIKSTGKWGGAGQPQAAFMYTFNGTRKKGQ